jgi:hypothetical protein
MKFSLVVFCVIVMGVSGFAQEPKSKTIDVTSTFKPVLREASKINFNAVPPVVDTSKPRLTYTIPVPSLYFTYQPAELKPVALQIDSITAWQYSNFIKVGIGNVHQPFVKAGFSFGDNRNSFFNVFATHYTSKGSLPFQKNSHTSVGGAATYKTSKNLEWNAHAGFSSDDYYLYGYRPATLVFTKDQLRQRFQTIEGKVHLRNMEPTEFGLNYHPSLSVSVFGDNHTPKGSESNTVLDLPLEKTFGDEFSFKLGATANLTNYHRNSTSTTSKLTVQNNLYLVSAAVLYKTPNLFIHGGIIPSWDNKAFKMLPNIMADITTNDQRLTLQLGWVGMYNKGSYQRFASINPWLAAPDTLANTKVIEFYGGIKGSLGDHFSYTTKVGFQRHANMPLFVNDKIDGKTFLIRYEPQLDVLQLHGEVGYNIGEQFSASAAATFNRFNLEKEKKAWGVLPVELNAKLRWRILKDLWLTSELWAFDGAWHTDKDLSGDEIFGQGKTAFDYNAGAEFRITKNFNLWVQFNNIFSSKYERWHQYEVYGFNVLGGITYSFNQK